MVHISGVRQKFPISRQEAALLAITAVWGSTFLLVHLAMRYSGPMFFVGVRFIVAGVIAALIFWRSFNRLKLSEVGAGAAIGLMIFLGYGMQTQGLQTINSSTSAFLTALYVPMVPLLQWVVFRKRPGTMTLVGAGIAFVGLLLLAGPDAVKLGLGPGEIVTLASTLPMAAEIILIGLFAGKVHLGRVTAIQLLVAGILGFAAMPAVGESVPEFSWLWFLPAVGLGAASCLIQATMNWAQKSVSPTRATIIYAGEPVWAGIIGRIAGDRLPGIALVGAALIILSTLVSELKPTLKKGKLEEIPAAANLAEEQA
ncbi:membrane protein [Glutamicibacter uratoxydans]|uniref:Membrane protein n=1 Tax=Glutamicibacter uratoxydans TaxID=43667 RepID=A0A4Y4DRT7_GLUUR|nr:DMT family transporter [Glutamicibacter uratoxydans]GED06088.1 membrane protein [Glutamicibacter uratoxydans]